MTAIEIENALVALAQEKVRLCEDKIAAIGKGQKTERKALSIQKEMYSLFLRAGLLYDTQSNRQNAIARNRQFLHKFLKKYPCYKALLDIYESLDGDTQFTVTPFLRGMTFMKTIFLDTFEQDMQKANDAGDVNSIFELNIKIGAIREMLEVWQAWWNENGFIKCEVIK